MLARSRRPVPWPLHLIRSLDRIPLQAKADDRPALLYARVLRNCPIRRDTCVTGGRCCTYSWFLRLRLGVLLWSLLVVLAFIDIDLGRSASGCQSSLRLSFNNVCLSPVPPRPSSLASLYRLRSSRPSCRAVRQRGLCCRPTLIHLRGCAVHVFPPSLSRGRRDPHRGAHRWRNVGLVLASLLSTQGRLCAARECGCIVHSFSCFV